MANNNPFVLYGMDQRTMGWPQTAPNERCQSQNLPHVNNHMNMTYTKPAGPHPTYSQLNSPSGQWPLSQLQLQTIHLLCEVRKEVLSQTNYSIPHQQLPELDGQFEKRQQLQQFLASRCTDPTMYRYVTSNDFLVTPDSKRFFEVIETLTGLDVTKFKKTPNIPAASNAVRPHPVQQNHNISQGSQYVDFQRSQIRENVGNYNQFLIHGSGGRSRNQVNNMAYSATPIFHQPLQPVNTYTQDESRSLVSQTSRVSASCQQRSWYKMPTERYECGRIVEQSENHRNPQKASLQSGISVGDSNESGSMNQCKTLSFRDHASLNQSAERVSIALDQHTDSQATKSVKSAIAVSVQSRVRVISQNVSRSNVCHNFTGSSRQVNGIGESLMSENRTVFTSKDLGCDNVKPSTGPIDSNLQFGELLSSSESTSKVVSAAEEDIVVKAIEKAPSKTDQQKTVCSKLLSGLEPVKENPHKCKDKMKSATDSARPSREESAQSFENVKSYRDNPKECSQVLTDDEKISNSDSLTKSLKDNKTVETHTSLGEYDPPLPVIKHKKRGDRISPPKKSPNTTNVDEDSSYHTGVNRPLEKKQKTDMKENIKVNREPLFSVLDCLSTTASDHSDRNHKSSSMSKHQEKFGNTNDSGVSKAKRKHTSYDKEKNCKRKLSEDSSRSSPEKSEFGKSNTRTYEHQNNHIDRCRKSHNARGFKGRTVENNPHSSENVGDSNLKQSAEVSAQDKVYSNWIGKNMEIAKGQNSLSRCHKRRKSCPAQKGHQDRPRKERSRTWDSSRTSTERKLEGEQEIAEKENQSFPPNKEFVWIHGQKLLLVSIPEGHHIVMKEFISTCLADHHSTEVYRKKTSELNINNKTLTHSCRRDVQKYLTSKNISCPSQIDIVSLSNAQKLFHHLKGIESCHEETCISMKPPSVSSQEYTPDTDPERKDRSVSPDSTVHGEKGSSTSVRGSLKADASRQLSVEESYQNDLQQNKVSSQSLDGVKDPYESDDQLDSSSSVSDATDIYCDGKPFPFQSVCEDSDDEVTDLDGGLAVVHKGNLTDKYVRVMVANGNKCFLYQDLFRLFGQTQVVKVVANDFMKVRTCTHDEVQYFNRNQPHLVPIDPVDSVIDEKCARKIFAYFGETFPTLYLPIDAKLNNVKLPLEMSEGTHDSQPPIKRLKRNERLTSEQLGHDGCSNMDAEKTGSHAVSEDASLGNNAAKCGQKRKFKDISPDQCVKNSKAAEVAALKAKLKETKKNNNSLAKRCKTYEADLVEVKMELMETITKNTDLELNWKKHEDTLSHLKVNLEAKEVENQTLQKERDHFKDFIERITDTYRIADDGGEMGTCDDLGFDIQVSDDLTI